MIAHLGAGVASDSSTTERRVSLNVDAAGAPKLSARGRMLGGAGAWPGLECGHAGTSGDAERRRGAQVPKQLKLLGNGSTLVQPWGRACRCRGY